MAASTNTKTFKLCNHNKTRPTDPNVDILINPKEFPAVRAKDILEIYHPGEEYSRLLLQYEELENEEQKQFNQKESVSIDQAIVAAFHLQKYKDVYVRKVSPQAVTLDLVELLFKEQYYSRNDMWRMRRSLVDTCAYLTKKVAYADMRAQVSELWARGEKVTCGVISDDTRIVFRSSTAVVSIFIQMSSEMWEFDNYGDLYFEKAVDGFLQDLLAKWKEQNCLHDVTIVLFSRTFYDAKSIDEFPRPIRDCVQQDYLGRFYEDFYRVVIQNERYEDWTNTLIQLKTLFNEYPNRVLHYHDARAGNQRIPTGRISTAAQGNFLETLNMALNLFEKWYIDRNFDRTGKVAVVLTPGAGVFEVDRELCNITKQRTIDCGVGSDLVCVGEQPLHAVPLFKFHNKSVNMRDMGDDYNIPHWMNHSFYTSRSQAQCLANSSFVPRIRPPPEVMEALLTGQRKDNRKAKKKIEDKIFSSPPYLNESEDSFQFIDYLFDEYDSQVFKVPSRSVRRGGVTDRSISFNASANRRMPSTLAEAKRNREPRDRHISDNFLDRQRAMSEEKHSPPMSIGRPRRLDSQDSTPRSVGCYPILDKASSKDSLMSDESDDSVLYRPIVGSAGSPVGYSRRTSFNNCRPNRALINPFAPSRMQFKMTSNRRRWVHAFPTDPRGAAVQTHHVHVSSGHSLDSEELGTSPPTREAVMAAQLAVEARIMSSSQEGEIADNYANGSMSPTMNHSFSGSLKGVPSGDNLLAGSETTGGLSPSNSQVTFDLPAVASTASVSSLVSGFDSGAKLQYLPSRSSRETATDLSYNRAWLWGPTGEQEWSPDITTGLDWRPLEAHELLQGESQLVKPILTTGSSTQSFCATISVDWKSIVIPASLPITTDYFPDKRSLNNDYVQNDYSLLPDDVNADYWMRPPSTDEDKFYRRQPLTTKEVFEELISQRLGQGFQLILLPKTSPGAVSVNSVVSSSPQYHGSGVSIRSRARVEQPVEEYCLSIGRIFHRLTLTWPNISVTRYRPRHPQPQLYFNYSYRFQAPDSFNYDVSWTKFSNEKLENYNWNYLDQYICTRGEGDYGLMESLRFWRSRFLLLPCNNQATKKIIEGSKYCDIYEEKTTAELKQLIDGFLRFLETLNKLRRTAHSRRTKGHQPKTAPSTPVKGSGTTQAGGNKQDPSNEERPKSGAEGVKGTDSANRSPAEVKRVLNPPSPLISQISTEVASVTMGYSADSPGTGKNADASRSLSPDRTPGISISTPSQDIIEAMSDPKEGFQFLTNVGLPALSFVSAEAVHWCIAHVKGVTSPNQAISLMQRLLDEKYIGHASRNPRHKFIYGFYLFVILQRESHDKARSSTELESPLNPYFTNEWCEVAVDPVDPSCTPLGQELSPLSQRPLGEIGKPASLSSSLEDWRSQSGLPEQDQAAGSVYHKFVNVDVDPTGKVVRPEWATARYHANYSPDCGFELQLQWMVATGTVLGELVYNWARKASQCGFHLLPVPIDPFDLPYTPNSDPLRGPIFVPLRMECLLQTEMDKIFEDCDDDTRVERLLDFQEAVLKRYGFVAGGVRLPHIQSYTCFEETQHHFAHCTGGMFVLIPDSRTIPAHDATYSQSYAQKASLRHHDYIARQTSRTDTRQQYKRQVSVEENTEHIGFLWSWNFMSTKRWRSPNTGDEYYQDKMLADFREFTSNAEDRLVNFWLLYRESNFPHIWGEFASA